MAGPDSADFGRRAGAWRAPDRGRPRRDVSRVGQGRRGQAATGGSRERRSAPRRRAMDAGSVTTARTVMRPALPVQRVTSTSKVRRKRVAQSSARKRRVERAAKESVPVRDGEDVRGHRKRRPRHEERRRRHRRRHSRSGCPACAWPGFPTAFHPELPRTRQIERAPVAYGAHHKSASTCRSARPPSRNRHDRGEGSGIGPSILR